jgi:hypothetical protein
MNPVGVEVEADQAAEAAEEIGTSQPAARAGSFTAR